MPRLAAQGQGERQELHSTGVQQLPSPTMALLPHHNSRAHLLALVALGGDVLPLLHDRLKQLLHSEE